MKAIYASGVLATAIVISFSATSQLVAQAPGEWRPLFNGKDLTGWTVAAGAAAARRRRRRTPAPRRHRRTGRSRTACSSADRAAARGSLVTDRAVQGLRAGARLHARRARHGVLGGADRRRAGRTPARTRTCLYNSGITFRTGYQLNIGRREAGEFIGIVVHRKAPGAIRGNVLWLDSGDEKFPNLRKKEDWNRLRISAKGPHITVS